MSDQAVFAGYGWNSDLNDGYPSPPSGTLCRALPPCGVREDFEEGEVALYFSQIPFFPGSRNNLIFINPRLIEFDNHVLFVVKGVYERTRYNVKVTKHG